MAQTIFDNSTGKFQDIDYHFHENYFWLTGYHFTKSNALKGNIRIFKSEKTDKRVNISLHTIKGKSIMHISEAKTHAGFEHVKHITIEEYDNFIQVKIYI